MNIAIFIRSLSKGGAEKQAILLTEYLSQFYQTYLIVYCKTTFDNHAVSPNLNIIYLEGNLFNKVFSLYKFFRAHKITHLFNYLPVNNVFGIIIGKLAGVKYMYGGIRGTKYKGRIKMILNKFLCNYFSTGFISNSYAAEESYSKYGLKKNKILVIHNAIKKISAKRCLHSNLIVLSVGRFTEQKDYFTAIDAISLLEVNYPQVKGKFLYKIIGYGKLKNEILEYIVAENLQDIIELRTDGKIGDSYNTSDILLNTSVHEGMPNVVMEAMNNGLPIIGTDSGDTKYLISDSKNGYLCPVRNSSYISGKLKELILNDSLRLKMGNWSKKIIDENFRPNKVYKVYVELIENNEK